jgi:hypothetical protein
MRVATRRHISHAEYGGHVASFALDGTLLVGSLPGRQLGLVKQWAELHAAELHANWEHARRLEPLEPIEPLA